MGVEMFDADGGLFAVGNAGFMASPNPAHEVSDGFPLDTSEERFRLAEPFAARVGAAANRDGTATVPFHLDNINATGAIQGGLLALVAEEALVDLAADGMAGPVAASSRCRCATCAGSVGHRHTRRHGSTARLGRSEIVDDEGRVGTLVTVRFAPT